MTGHAQEPFGLCFERRVELTPDRIAVATPNHQFTYAEIADRARKIARRVQAVSTEEQARPIALMMEHGVDAVVGVVGILSAARGYLPLDPHVPADRLAKMLQLSGATRILTDRAHAQCAREMVSASVEVLVYEAVVAEPAAARVLAPVDDSTLGALLFTSGTTGEPKGVPLLQKNIMRNVRMIANDIGLTADDRFSLITALSYMPSTFGMLGPLLVGASTHPYNIREEGVEGILPWLKASEISVLLTVPTIFRKMAAQIKAPVDVASVRHVHLAGEPMVVKDLELFRERFSPSARLFTEIGTTETGTFAGHFIDGNTKLERGVVPTGFPFSDTQVLLKKEDGSDAAPGEEGELYIRGPHVGTGYWRRPDLSEGRFFQDAVDPRVWTYRTGDIAIRREDDCLITLGRKDDQVKINGVRVEPAEVQAVVSALPGVCEAAVIAPMNDDGERRLIAYVVGEAGVSLTSGGLRAAVAEKLSTAMTPAAFVVLDFMPTTDSGKVDRKALPDPADAASTTLSSPGPVEIDDEAQVFLGGLIAAFESILERSGVGANDDFFLLGGDSLKAVALMSALEESFNVAMPVSVMMTCTTPAQLAEQMKKHVRKLSTGGVLRLSGWDAQPGELTPIFCIPGAGGHVLCFRHFIAELGVANPCYGLEYPGLKGEIAPLETVEAIAEHFVEDIVKAEPTGPVVLLGHSVGGCVAFEVSRRLNALGRATPMVAFLDSLAPGAMRHLGLREKGKLFVKYLMDSEQSGKIEMLAKRGTQHLRKKLYGLRLKIAPPKNWEGADDPDAILSAVTNTYIRQVVVACQKASYAYQPSPFAQEVVQFRCEGSQSPLMSQRDSYSEWESITEGGIREVMVPGEHRDVLNPPAISLVAETLRGVLASSDHSAGAAA